MGKTKTELMLWMAELIGGLIDRGEVGSPVMSVDFPKGEVDVWVNEPHACKITIIVKPTVALEEN